MNYPKNRTNHSVDVRIPKSDYIGISKTKRRKRAISKRFDNRSEEDKASSCRFNEEVPLKTKVLFLFIIQIRKVARSQGSNEDAKSVVKSYVSKDDTKSIAKTEISNKESLRSEIIERLE